MIARGRTQSRSRRTDRGAVMVEFAFVAVLFFTILIAIISFGILLAFKQNMTQAASESARASIAVVDNPATNTIDERKDVALASMEGAMGEFDRQCYVTAECMAIVHECSVDANFAVYSTTDRQNRAALVIPSTEPVDPCMSTRIEFDNENSRILPPFPIISAFEPDRLSSETTVRLVPVPDLSATTTTSTTSTSTP